MLNIAIAFNPFFILILCFFFVLKEIARKIRPNTIRAKFGANIVKNAVHCTDLEEECLNEVEYFFKILSK